MRTNVICLFLLVAGTSCSAQGQGGAVLSFRGTSDASAAVAVRDDLFVVADDENNTLRIYRWSQPGMPVSSFDLTAFLKADPERPEADIEGAARIGDRIYWITSHGRNSDGKLRPTRYRLFATEIRTQADRASIVPVGRPYADLARRLVAEPALASLGLDRAVRIDDDKKLSKKEREQLAPKARGLNIEGLAAAPDAKTLYIGLRNPTAAEPTTGSARAIMIPLLNGADVVESGSRPRFAAPLLWDLAGLGIRSMEYSLRHKAYFIVAGRRDEGGRFALYRWSGREDEQPIRVRELELAADFTPEALFFFADGERACLLSDDGTIPVQVSGPAECLPGEMLDDGFCPNKFLVNPERKCCRAVEILP